MFKSLKATFTIGLFIIALCCNAQEPKLMLPIGDKASLSSLYFSPDGSKIAIPGWKNERIYIWDVNTGKILTTVNVQDEYFNINRFSQDGKRLLVNYGEIWDIENQQLLLNIDSVLFNIDSTLFYKRKIEFEIDSVLSIIDTTALGSHSWSKEFREKAISDCADKNPEAVSICKCAFNKIEIKYPNEKEVAAKVTIHDFNLMCKECVIRDTIYNLRDTANIEILPNWGIVEFNSNLTQVAISKDSIIYLINIPQNKIIGKLNSDKISSLTYSPDGKYLAGIAKNQILVWNIEDHKFLYNIGSANKIFFTPDSKKLITSDSAKITIHDIFTGKSLTEFLSDKVESMAFSSDSKKIIVSINEDGKNEKYKAILFDIDKSKVLNKWANISNILFYPDNESIIVTYVLDSAIGAKVEIWNSNTNKLVGSRNIYSNLLEISDDGSKIAEDGQEYNLVTIVNSKTGAKISEWNWQGHIPKDGIEKLKGSRIIISYKTHVNIWDSQTGEWLPYASIGNNDDDNKILASDSSTSALLKNGIWQIWNSRSEKLILKSNKKFSGNVVSCISGNSQQVAFAFQNKEKRFLEIYDLKELKKVKQFPLPSSPLKDIFFSPDNTKLILSYEDLNITEIRQASTFLLVKKIPGHISEFSPDGTKVIINLGEKDGSQSVYSITNVNTGRILLHDYGVAIFSPIENIIVNNSGNIYNLKNNKTLEEIDSLKNWPENDDDIFDVPDFRFSNDGKKLILMYAGCSTDGNCQAVSYVWDFLTKKLIQTPNDANEFSNESISASGKKRAISIKNENIKIIDIDKKDTIYLANSENEVCQDFSSDDKSFTSLSDDGILKIWNVNSGRLLYSFSSIDSADYLVLIPSGYYLGTKNAAKLLHYVTPDLKVITFEQLDIKYNRPDKVLQAIGNADTALIKSYRRAYEKRIKKLGIDTTAFKEGYGLPVADFANRDSIIPEKYIKLHITGKDTTYLIDRFNVWINEVPIYGVRGISLKSKNKHTLDTTITVALSNSINIIETSITNFNGTESYRMPLQIYYSPAQKAKEKLYFVGIGTDKFVEDKHNLHYSVKDIRDLAQDLKKKYGDDMIIVDTLFDEKVSIASVAALKQKLQRTSINDKVILSFSGHGLLSDSLDYYLSTYNVNFTKPEQGGLPYEELENLMDGIPARKKLMMIDACNSGEVDKDENKNEILNDTIQKKDSNESYTGKGIRFKKGPSKLGMKNSFELMKILFVNVGRSTGSTIISAAGGLQSALEGGGRKNGIFTSAVLEYMDKNSSATVTELKNYVNKRVPELTQGLQQPTSRAENKLMDWRVW